MSPAHLVAMSTLKLHFSSSTYYAPNDESSPSHKTTTLAVGLTPLKTPALLATPTSCSCSSSQRLGASPYYTPSLSSSRSHALSARPSLASIRSDVSSPLPSPLPTDDESDEPTSRGTSFRPAARALALSFGSAANVSNDIKGPNSTSTWSRDRSRPGLRKMPSWGSLSAGRSRSSGASSDEGEIMRDFDAGLGGIAELSEIDAVHDHCRQHGDLASFNGPRHTALKASAGQFDDAPEEARWLSGRLDKYRLSSTDSTASALLSDTTSMASGKSSRRLVGGLKRLVRPSLSIFPPAHDAKLSDIPSRQIVITTPVTPAYSIHPSLLETNSTLHLDLSDLPDPLADRERADTPVDIEPPLRSASLAPKLEVIFSDEGGDLGFSSIAILGGNKTDTPELTPESQESSRGEQSYGLSLSDMLADAPDDMSLSPSPVNNHELDADTSFNIFSPRVQQAPALRALVGSIPPSPLELPTVTSLNQANYPTPVLPRNAPPSPDLTQGTRRESVGVATYLGSPPLASAPSIPSIRETYPSPNLASSVRSSRKLQSNSRSSPGVIELPTFQPLELDLMQSPPLGETSGSGQPSSRPPSSPPPTVPEQPAYRPRTSYFASRCPPPLLSPTLQDLQARRGSLTMPIPHLPIQTPPSLLASPRMLSPPLMSPGAGNKILGTARSSRISTRRTSGAGQLLSYGTTMPSLSGGVQAFRQGQGGPEYAGVSNQILEEVTEKMDNINPYFA